MATIRPRNARQPFEIHHDEFDPDEDLDAEDNGMDESRDEDADTQEDGYSDYSDESDEVVDPTVREDMDKFMETFKGIKERFRLINRIGEGRYIPQHG